MRGNQRRPLVVIGLDGATFDLLIPWMKSGRLPALARLWRCGSWARLASTVPPATFPAWTSLFTGVNPGRHGVLDFTQRVEGSHRVRVVGRRDRRVAALWNHLSRAGGRVAVVTVPVTYPPEEVPGIMVSGWDSPLATGIDGSFVHPRRFHDEIRRTVGRLPFADFQEVAPGPGWHEAALASLLDGVERRTRVVELILAKERWDLLAVVFGESDTVAHHFWRFHDRRSPRWTASPFGDALAAIYEALDRAVDRVLRAMPSGAAVAVVSDHGSGGAGTRVVHLNRRLADAGLLRFRDRASSGLVSAIRSAALAHLPHRVQGPLVRRAAGIAGRLEGWHRGRGIDWRSTQAYSDELDYAPSVRLNVIGREPQGTVAPARYDTVRSQVMAHLDGWRDDEGYPVVERVWRREELYHGPATSAAPDVILELRAVDGYSPACLRSDGPGPALRELSLAEYGAGRGAGMSGAHRRDGVLMLAGGGVAPVGDLGCMAITDVLPTLLALAGLPAPTGLDGAVARMALEEEPPAVDPAVVEFEMEDRPPDASSATAEIRARLEALGYLEPELR